ncbi:rhodanese-like domain-containing protein [Geobacillus vulcani]
MEEIKEITPAEVKEKLERGEKLNIVDVREDEEVALGMIPGAKHIKMGDIPDRLEEFDRNEEYIFVCRSGRRSENVCRYLQERGYRVRNMTGGMLEWEGETAPKQ